MKIKVQIPRVLEKYCDGNLEIGIKGDTVAELLAQLQHHYPALYVCVCDETGRLRQHINLFVNNDLLVERQDLATRLAPGDVVSIFQAVSGG
jgi:molybdopterin converting factor small subunit